MESVSATTSELLRRLELENEKADTKNRLQDYQHKKEKGVEQIGKFVGYFYGMMLQEMRKTLPEKSFMDGGSGEKIFSQQLDFHLGEEIALEKKDQVTPDGYQRHQVNPLVEEMSKSLMKTLNRQIENLETRLSRLDQELVDMESLEIKTTDLLMEDLEQLTSETQKMREKMDLDLAGRLSALIDQEGNIGKLK